MGLSDQDITGFMKVVDTLRENSNSGECKIFCSPSFLQINNDCDFVSMMGTTEEYQTNHKSAFKPTVDEIRGFINESTELKSKKDRCPQEIIKRG